MPSLDSSFLSAFNSLNCISCQTTSFWVRLKGTSAYLELHQQSGKGLLNLHLSKVPSKTDTFTSAEP